MDGLVPYSLPIKGLHNGIHEFSFQIGSDFFSNFEDSPIEACQIELALTLDKRPSMMVLEFDFDGTVRTECDRCLASINLPIEGHQRLVVKYSEDAEQEDADMIFVHPEASDLNVATYIYEFIVLAVPMIKVYDCQDEENPPCNFEMLAFLSQNEDKATENAPESNPVWDALKNLKKDN